ncbi:hypothetical protein CU633_13470 [Bacillus sp. V3-13]|uniref:helix-turn-helix domain-containing protein n=1 Tax=Bacillus sp. V3-13 TaxID=2053728 RepID=UPI000C78C9D8|nr:helix-turn-helix domain-containing protein [Bacillus sp. V3-13]PLR76909.1 hypothetical protein CU633_13470 [Bacillus sp. V3-13]
MLYKRWTTEEVDYLKVSVGNKKVPVIANQLRRTEKAVIAKMKRLGISQTKSHTGMLTMNELAKHLHVDPNTVKNWIDNHHLKSSVKITRTTRKFTFINPEDFWEWASEHKSKINFQKIDAHAILPEPKWVENERKKKREFCLLQKVDNQRDSANVMSHLKGAFL